MERLITIDDTYGCELILDLHNCDPATFTRKHLRKYFKEICNMTDMQRAHLVFWDYKGFPEEYKKAPDHLKGTSAIQFITTSNITIHTIDVFKKVFINIFTCKDFTDKTGEVVNFTEQFFKGTVVNNQFIRRM